MPSHRSALLAVLLFTALLRGGVLWVQRDNLTEDRDAYRQIAENLATYGVYGLGNGIQTPRPTAYRPPVYPVMLAKIAGEGLAVTPLRVAMLHWALGMGTVWVTWLVAGKLAKTQDAEVGSRRVSGLPSDSQHTLICTLAALLVACDPILLHWSTYVMTETLAAFLAVLALYTLTRFHSDRRPMNAGFAGCALGLAILCRPTFLPWAALCGVGFLFLQASGGRQPPDTNSSAKESLVFQYARRLANLAAFGVVAAVVVFPWGYRNYQQFGKPIITTTHGGYTLYLANNGFFYDHLRYDKSGLPWNPAARQKLPNKEVDSISFEELLEVQVLSSYQTDTRSRFRPRELVVDKVLYSAAVSDISARPLIFAYSCLYRAYQLWSPLPSKLTAGETGKRALLRYAIAAWYLAVYAAAVAGVWGLRGKLLRSPWVWGVLLCLVFTLVHTFYWSNLRMRAPLMPFVAIVAAVGAQLAVTRFGELKARRQK